jgi:hypothetical protein
LLYEKFEDTKGYQKPLIEGQKIQRPTKIGQMDKEKFEDVKGVIISNAISISDDVRVV